MTCVCPFHSTRFIYVDLLCDSDTIQALGSTKSSIKELAGRPQQPEMMIYALCCPRFIPSEHNRALGRNPYRKCCVALVSEDKELREGHALLTAVTNTALRMAPN